MANFSPKRNPYDPKDGGALEPAVPPYFPGCRRRKHPCCRLGCPKVFFSKLKRKWVIHGALYQTGLCWTKVGNCCRTFPVTACVSTRAASYIRVFQSFLKNFKHTPSVEFWDLVKSVWRKFHVWWNFFKSTHIWPAGIFFMAFHSKVTEHKCVCGYGVSHIEVCKRIHR